MRYQQNSLLVKDLNSLINYCQIREVQTTLGHQKICDENLFWYPSNYVVFDGTVSAELLSLDNVWWKFTHRNLACGSELFKTKIKRIAAKLIFCFKAAAQTLTDFVLNYGLVTREQ